MSVLRTVDGTQRFARRRAGPRPNGGSMTAMADATTALNGGVLQRRQVVTALPGPRSEALQVGRDRALPRGLGKVLPIFVERAGGGIIVDVDGNHLIDFASGIAVTSVGASAPAVVDAVSEQVARFTHTCFLVTEYESYVEVAQRLNELTPGDHAKTTALFSTGSEAIENAVKIARVATGRSGVITFDDAFHGRGLFTLAMTAKEVPYKRGFGPFSDQVHRAPFPNPLRWPAGAEKAAEEALAALRSLLAEVGPDTIAAIVVEPIQGEGGFVVPAPGFLPGLVEIAAEHGIVLIADEIQAGIARTGQWFACDHEGVVPDLIVTAKALAGGLPLAAVTGRAEIMDAADPGALGGTYAGNPLACAAALATLRTIEEADLIAAARRIEEVVRDELQPLVGEGGPVVDLRGRGAMMAVELVRPGTTEPDPGAAATVAKRCHEQGVVVLVSGTQGNVLRLLPPLVIGEDLLREGLRVIVDAIEDI